MNQLHEPLQPPPQWVYTSGAGWHDTTAHVTHARVADPASFVHGYEQGAYALAAYLNARLTFDGERGLRFVMDALRDYRQGRAHPVQGWQHEPKRN